MNRRNRSFVSVVVIVTTALSLLAGGCASSGAKPRSQTAVGSLTETRDEVAAARKQVDEVLAAANAINNPDADLRKSFDTLRKEIKDTESQAAKTRKRSEDMQTRAAEYQQRWQTDITTVSNPELRAAAEARAAEVRSRYTHISQLAQQARAAYDPFIRDLTDLQTYLTNDLSAASVRAAGPTFQKINADGAALNQRIDAVLNELNALVADLSPSPR